MTAGTLYRMLEEKYPKDLSCAWDRDGMMVCPDPGKAVSRVLLCLDCDRGAAEYALKGNFDLIVSHHPLIFHPVSSLTSADPVTSRALLLYSRGISVFSFHTRLDCAEGGVNDTLCRMFGLSACFSFDVDGKPMGRIGTLPKEMSGRELGQRVKELLGCSCFRGVGLEKTVRRLAVLGGSGGADAGAALAAGADAYLTGEASHHQLLDSADRGLCMIAAGHDYTERPVCKALEKAVLALSPGIYTEIYDKISIETV